MADDYNYESAYGKFSLWVAQEYPATDMPIEYDMSGTIVGGTMIEAFGLDTPIFNETHVEFGSEETLSLKEMFDVYGTAGDRYFLSIVNSHTDVSDMPVNYVAIFNFCDPKIEPSKSGPYVFIGTFDYDEEKYMSLI